MPEILNEAERHRLGTEVIEADDAPSRRSWVRPTQVVAGALAAVTAAVAASKLGVAGTVMGAALGSVVATVGGSVYEQSLNRTHARVRTTLQVRRGPAHAPNRAPAPPVAAASGRGEQPPATPAVPRQRTAGLKRSRLGPRLAVATLASFVLAIGAITAVELLAGEPVSGLTGGNAGSGTTIGRSLTDGTSTDQKESPTPSAPAKPEKSAVTPSQTSSVPATPSPEATPTTEPTPSASTDPSPPPSSEPPTASPTPSASGALPGGEG